MPGGILDRDSDSDDKTVSKGVGEMNLDAKWLTRAAILLALALAVQSLRLGQYITGPVVNAVLLSGAVLVGPWGAAAIGLLTPLTAFLLGQLSPILAPAIPFIMAGNAVLALLFGYGRKTNVYLALVVAAVVKYLVLAGAVRYILALPPKVGIALQMPQLITALIGGLVAIFVLEALSAAKLLDRAQWSGLGLRRANAVSTNSGNKGR